MSRKGWKLVIGIAILTIAIAVGISLWHFKPIHNDDLGKLAPLQNARAAMTLEEVDLILGEKYDVVKTIGRIPDTVKASFCRVEVCAVRGARFDMVNPGAAMSTDYLIPGVPNKRLRFAALNSHAAVVAYELGGFATTEWVVIVDLQDLQVVGGST